MVEISSIPFNQPVISGNEVSFIEDAIKRCKLSGDGYYTKLCNSALNKITGAHSSLITHSGTAALEMAAILCDLKPGDEVIMPSFTFVSTANAVVLRGATPVFVDIEEISLNIDPDEVEKAITKKTKAIFAVHYAGRPANMEALAKISQKYNLVLVEDAAQALGSKYKNRSTGSLGDMAAFSFHETKNLICGEGGALTIMRQDLIERAEIIREKGTNRSSFLRGETGKYTWLDIGSSYLPSEIIAAFLYGQLKEIDKILHKRLKIYNRYARRLKVLSNSSLVKLPTETELYQGNGHIFYLILQNETARDSFIQHMLKHGIATPFHYIPLHTSPAGKIYGKFKGTLYNTDRVSAGLVRLPNFYSMEEPMVEKVIDVILNYFRLQSS